MKLHLSPLLLAAAAGIAVLAPPAAAQRGAGGGPGPGLVEPAPGKSIAWFGTLEAGRAEAARTSRPILFLSAAPLCSGVPGVW